MRDGLSAGDSLITAGHRSVSDGAAVEEAGE